MQHTTRPRPVNNAEDLRATLTLSSNANTKIPTRPGKPALPPRSAAAGSTTPAARTPQISDAARMCTRPPISHSVRCGLREAASGRGSQGRGRTHPVHPRCGRRGHGRARTQELERRYSSVGARLREVRNSGQSAAAQAARSCAQQVHSVRPVRRRAGAGGCPGARAERCARWWAVSAAPPRTLGRTINHN